MSKLDDNDDDNNNTQKKKNKVSKMRMQAMIEEDETSSKLNHHSSASSSYYYYYSLLLLCYLILLSSLATFSFYRLPDPVDELDLSQFSEVRARKHIKYLSKDIGSRMVGTEGENRAIHYLINQLNILNNQTKHKFDISVTQGSNQHLFEIINVPIIKLYHNITNIAVRVQCTTQCDQSILINTHYDGQVSSNGAADAATPCAIMLDTIRYVSQVPVKNTLVFLFNGAEESFQDGSHLFIYTHSWFKNVVTVLNLEAAGVSGKSVLFQSKSKLMLNAYSHVKYPHGTSASNELFASGILISDTDYKQFMDHGNLLGGLDTAIYQHSYLYHTKLDTEEMIPSGTVQHFGQNTLDIVKYLAYTADLKTLYNENDDETVYFDFLGLYFVQFSNRAATLIEISLSIISLVYLYTTSSPYQLFRSVLDTFKVLGQGLIYPIAISLLCTTSESYKLAWFNEPIHASIMYGLPTLYGFLQGHLTSSNNRPRRYLELYARKAMLFICTLVLTLMLFFQLKSAFLIGIFVASHLFATMVVPSALYYYSCSTFVILVAQPMLIGFINTFVPLTGRMGPDIAAEVIIALLVWLSTVLLCIPLVPILYQLHPVWIKRISRSVRLIGCLVWLSFMLTVPRNTDLTPKRMVLLHTLDMDNGQSGLHLVKADSGAYPKEAIQLVKQVMNGTDPNLQMSRNEMFMAHQAIYPLSELTHSVHWNTTHLNPTTLWTDASVSEYAPRLDGVRSTLEPGIGRTIVIPCLMNAHSHVTVFRFDAQIESASVPVKKHAKYGQYFIRQSVGGFGGTAGDTYHDGVYQPSPCDFRMTVLGTDPITIHAASLTRRMGTDHAILNSALPMFPSSIDIMLVDAVHQSIVV